MLVIRLQRTGRSGHASFRIVVQDSRQSPTSGKFVALIGNYDPHSKVVNIDKDKTKEFIKNGAQPSDRVAGLLKKEGVKLPDWINVSADKTRTTRNAEKLRKNRPAEEKVAELKAEDKPAETPAEDAEPAKTEETPGDETAASETPEPEAEKVTEETSAEEEIAAESEKTEEPEAKGEALKKA